MMSEAQHSSFCWDLYENFIMASVSEVKMSNYTSESSESSQEQSSEASEDSFVSANEDFNGDTQTGLAIAF